jgi:hypothetical protein
VDRQIQDGSIVECSDHVTFIDANNEPITIYVSAVTISIGMEGKKRTLTEPQRRYLMDYLERNFP